MDSLPIDEGSAGRLVQARLQQLVDRVAIHESRVRHQQPGGVHKMRVTLRRLRSLLATFRSLFAGDTAPSLREELKWIAGELGGARDAQVTRGRLKALASTPEEEALADRIDRGLDAAETEGVQRSVAALDSERYERAFGDLNAFVADPPWEPEAARPADEILRRLVRRDLKRLRRRAARADELSDEGERQAALHEVRKAAKRLRYSAEALVPTYGDDAARLARRAKKVQTVLGELQDSVVSREAMRDLAGVAEKSSEAFVLGGLHTREEQLAAAAEERYAELWAKLDRKRHRRWLR